MQGFTLNPKNTILEKPHRGGGSQIEYSNAFLELKNPFFGNEKGCDADREARGAVNSVWITAVF